MARLTIEAKLTYAWWWPIYKWCLGVIHMITGMHPDWDKYRKLQDRASKVQMIGVKPCNPELSPLPDGFMYVTLDGVVTAVEYRKVEQFSNDGEFVGYSHRPVLPNLEGSDWIEATCLGSDQPEYVTGLEYED